MVAPKDRPADWTARDLTVATRAGETVDVNVPVGKGGFLEVVLQDAATGKPIENATASVNQAANFGRNYCWYYSVSTNAEGLARLRVPAGECRLSVWGTGYSNFSNLEQVTVVRGEVVRREVRLETWPAAAGTVRDPNGQHAAGVIVNSRPVCEEPACTDEQGRFRVTWYPHQSLRTVLILARDPARNLAGLAERKDPSEPVDVTLAPAFVIRGRVTDPNDRPVPAATVAVRASMPGWLTGAAPGRSHGRQRYL